MNPVPADERHPAAGPTGFPADERHPAAGPTGFPADERHPAAGPTGFPALTDYLRAAQRLDAVRREAAAAVSAQTTAAQTARKELGTLQQRLALQRARLTDLANRAGVAVPP